MDMKIVIRGTEDTANLRSFAEDKVTKSLERFQQSILNVTVRLEDVTGPDRRGVDKQCSIEVKLRTGDVRVKEQGEDFRATINTTLDRLKATLSRKVGKAKRGIGEG